MKLFLGIRWLESTYTLNDVSEAIQVIINDFDIPNTKILSVCHGESVSLKAAVHQLFGEEKSVLCLAHVLHVIVSDALDDVNSPTLKNVVSQVETAVEYINQNYSRFSDQSVFTEEEAESILRLFEYFDDGVPTKKNIFCLILDNVLRLLPCLVRVIENEFEEIPKAFTNLNVEVLTEISQLLSSVEEATNELSANACLTGSIIIPMINCVKSFLQRIPLVYDVSKLFREKLLWSLEARAQEFLMNPLLRRATFCDPRFKKMYISSGIVNSVIEECCGEVRQNLQACSAVPLEEPASVTALWRAHDENMAKQKTNDEMPYEFQVYLEQMLLPRTADPFQFWLQNQGCMPSLSRIALKNLCVCGTSISVEKSVTVLKEIFSDDRFCWTKEHITQRLFLNQLDKEYWKKPNG